jgi:hypothetical protein
MPMQAHADSDALSLALERAGEPRWRQAAALSVQDHCDVSQSAHPEIERDASTPYNHQGSVVAASAWLTFYVFAVIYPFIASGN